MVLSYLFVSLVLVERAVAAPGDLLRTFAHPEPEKGGIFGASVTALGQDVVIGNPRHAPPNLLECFPTKPDDSLFEPNADYGVVYLIDSTTGFGQSVAFLGRNLLVGAHIGGETLGQNAGAVYLFDGASGEVKHAFFNPTPQAEDQFGYSITTIGEHLLVGAPGDDAAGVDTGAAYLFDTLTGELL